MNIVRISVQRYVVSGDIVNSITAYDERDYRIGREQRVYQTKPLTDSEVKKIVNTNVNEEIHIDREILGPAVAKRW
jgi:hypothetical protein